MYSGPKDRTRPALTGAAVTACRRCGVPAWCSSSVPNTTPKPPADPPWSWKPVAWPGSQLISQTSYWPSTWIRSYQRPSALSRTRAIHSRGVADSLRTSSASSRGLRAAGMIVVIGSSLLALSLLAGPCQSSGPAEGSGSSDPDTRHSPGDEGPRGDGGDGDFR